MSEYIVEMKNITKRFPGIVANNNVTLQIKKGEIYAILGENGAGKSTLMSMLFGMYEPDEGEIFIRGKKEVIASPKYATELNIGMVHQHFKLVENYTVTENIIMGIEPIKKVAGIFPKVDLKTANQKVLELSKKHELEVEPTKKIESLNVSIQQRVEILKMLYREAEILIFDEPTAVLTPQEIVFFLRIIQGLREEGKTIILITHKLEEIKQVADRCAVLRQGELMAVVETAKTSTQMMSKLMVGREVSLTMEKSTANFRKIILDVANITVKNEVGFPVVDDVSFSIRGGEIFAIAGVSGNGQVEIGDAITGLAEISTGSITLAGVELSKKSIRERILAGISYIPEDRHEVGLVLDFSLENNLLLKNYYQEPYCQHGLLKPFEFKQTSERYIKKYDIRSGQGVKTITRSMSGGNQQKAIIAREIQQDSSLVIFVQPTRGLDVGAIENIHKQIIAERDKGKAILLISLELEEVMNLADTIGVICSGKLQKIEAAAKLSKSEVGEYMMGVKSH
ncbi:ABC transporter ATP-binding protein [Enterococcus rivorum]|uniref:Heme ABC transporter ATP-binding protein n=1 Tax=Enterococcus rivorum TaxID=762845 RepID=A0A1E5KV64_9ENTE|nr:ABC transporter ATP-binding protein [Enterococcus rivorum]MBP2100387.1 simple sugar transport system ATP-binding protein [Enterococcus rivorum]OEH81771.1 heme ABC transporter ATP-binding protein [Enterococcus rivorum]